MSSTGRSRKRGRSPDTEPVDIEDRGSRFKNKKTNPLDISELAKRLENLENEQRTEENRNGEGNEKGVKEDIVKGDGGDVQK